MAVITAMIEATPATMPGRASGKVTLRKVAKGPSPSVRLTSTAHTDWARKAARVSM